MNVKLFDNDIDMDSVESLKDTKILSIMPQKGRFIFNVGPGGIVFAAGRLLIVSIIILDHKKKMMDNKIDRNIEHFDIEIDMTGLEELEGTRVGNIKPQVVHFDFPDDPGAIVLASDRFLTVNNASLDQTKKLMDNAIDGNIGHFDIKIDMTGLVNVESGDTMLQVSRFIFPDGSGVIVLVTCRIF